MLLLILVRELNSGNIWEIRKMIEILPRNMVISYLQGVFL